MRPDPNKKRREKTCAPVRRRKKRQNEAVQHYVARSGRDMSHLTYYFVFGTFKIAVVLQQIYHRYHHGQTKDARFEPFGAVAEALFQLAAARRP
ncbi:MAG: hypothetical protein A2Y95_00120 [Deltaproteobacteria bacterium RBG_13_65_10]|nr:MAG: hypothetical protein A2Y95_00120 [Deltaproteobacteria bacterium RBG_13_65_10]